MNPMAPGLSRAKHFVETAREFSLVAADQAQAEYGSPPTLVMVQMPADIFDELLLDLEQAEREQLATEATQGRRLRHARVVGVIVGAVMTGVVTWVMGASW